jgi:hypothetical protein
MCAPLFSLVPLLFFGKREKGITSLKEKGRPGITELRNRRRVWELLRADEEENVPMANFKLSLLLSFDFN